MGKFDRETPGYTTPAVETPYVKAKQAWDNRLAVFAMGANQWRKIALASMGLAVVLLILLLISLSWHKPNLYIAEVTHEGQVVNVKLLAQAYQPNEAQEEYLITQFIKLVRSVPLDPVAAKNNWLDAYNFLSDRGAQELNQFFQKNNPLADLSKKTVTVTITDINPLSKNSYQVDWTEQSIDQNGQIIGQQDMSGVFTIEIEAPKTKQQMLLNPLGIYIIDFHMSAKMNTGGQ
jgi:type IV secretory pathway TrbF-like protein